MKSAPKRSFLKQIKIGWRDTVLLLREFRQSLFLFMVGIIGCGYIYYLLAKIADETIDSIPKAIYLILSMTFLQSPGEFPKTWYLQIFFFTMPILGIAILSFGLADFGTLFFNRKSRGKEWEMAVASTLKDHIILLGLGQLGYRVVGQLVDFKQDVVVIDLNPNYDLMEKVRSYGIPVIIDDGTREAVLVNAGLKRARSIVLCMEDDSLNLQIALKARNINPKIRVILRIFDDDFADSLTKQFGFIAISAPGISAPIFAAAATDINMTPPLIIENQPHSLAHFAIKKQSDLIGKVVQQIEDDYAISIVLIMKNGQRESHPKGATLVEEGDILAILGEPEKIYSILQKY